MANSEILSVFQWWAVLVLLGLACLPLTFALFRNFFDKGYIFSKILGLAIVSYVILFSGVLHVLPFSRIFSFSAIVLVLSGNILAFWKTRKQVIRIVLNHWKLFLFEELLFLGGIFYWSYVRGFAPDIHGLEKYMDFGFINSILRMTFPPPRDMWYTPYPINYYYFGHFTVAVLTRLSNLPSSVTFNLMLGTIFSFTYTCSFSIGANLWFAFKGEMKKISSKISIFFTGLLSGFLVTFGGNLHTIYTLFKAYPNDNPVPIWKLQFSPGTFPNAYWYPNATRFIYHTIHEFPIYSFVVSDLHGHVLDIPFVLLAVAVLFSLIFFTGDFLMNKINNNEGFFVFLSKKQMFFSFFIGFLLAVMYMTNAWDGLIYFLLAIGAITYGYIGNQKDLSGVKQVFLNSLLPQCLYTFGFFLLLALPFSLFFQVGSIAHGVGVLCAPTFLTNIGKIGPFLFEANHCQKSPLWQLLTLYGFFYFWVISFFVLLFSKRGEKNFLKLTDTFILLLITLATLLIVIPEFFYLKDIYPDHYRANTMFKLVYQSFIMLSIVSAYSIMRIKTAITFKKLYIGPKIGMMLFTVIATGLFVLVAIYPYFAINSYYGEFKVYHGLDGTQYLSSLYPSDYQAIQWINGNIKGQPVMLEAQGDSYTDYERISTNTGLPTPLGWTVHEWLWRGTYDIVAPRIGDVQSLYTTSDLYLAKKLINNYKISYVYIGLLEHQKYPTLSEDKFSKLGKIVYKNKNTTIYKLAS